MFMFLPSLCSDCSSLDIYSVPRFFFKALYSVSKRKNKCEKLKHTTHTVTGIIQQHTYQNKKNRNHIKTCTHTHTHMHIRTHTHTHTCTHMHTHTCTHTHACTHTYTHTHTHTHTTMPVPVQPHYWQVRRKYEGVRHRCVMLVATWPHCWQVCRSRHRFVSCWSPPDHTVDRSAGRSRHTCFMLVATRPHCWLACMK